MSMSGVALTISIVVGIIGIGVSVFNYEEFSASLINTFPYTIILIALIIAGIHFGLQRLLDEARMIQDYAYTEGTMFYGINIINCDNYTKISMRWIIASAVYMFFLLVTGFRDYLMGHGDSFGDVLITLVLMLLMIPGVVIGNFGLAVVLGLFTYMLVYYSMGILCGIVAITTRHPARAEIERAVKSERPDQKVAKRVASKMVDSGLIDGMEPEELAKLPFFSRIFTMVRLIKITHEARVLGDAARVHQSNLNENAELAMGVHEMERSRQARNDRR